MNEVSTICRWALVEFALSFGRGLGEGMTMKLRLKDSVLRLALDPHPQPFFQWEKGAD